MLYSTHQHTAQAVKRESGSIRNSVIVLIAFATAFFPRILDTLGAPSPINFLHFATIPFACGVALLTTKAKDRKQNQISFLLIGGIFFLAIVTLASAIINDAGLINAVIHFMLLGEPYILLLAIISIQMSEMTFRRFRLYLLRFALINLVLFYIQFPLIGSGYLHAGGFTPQDGAAGVFYVSGAGNYISASVSMVCAMYFYTCKGMNMSKWLRFALLAAAFIQVHLSDSKQILLAMIVAWILLILLNSKDIAKTLRLAIIAAILLAVFWWAIYNIESLIGFTAWIRPEMYGLDGAAQHAKFGGIRIVLSHYESPLNWLFGLGPGHTIGRLGGWFLRDYWSLLGPLGATVHPVSAETEHFMKTFWLTSLSGSSMFNPFFGWAGVWGDIGFLGLGAYFFLAGITWSFLCKNDLPKYFLLTAFVLGLIFTQIEEPGYMLTVATVVGLKWHENRLTLNALPSQVTLSKAKVNSLDAR